MQTEHSSGGDSERGRVFVARGDEPARSAVRVERVRGADCPEANGEGLAEIQGLYGAFSFPEKLLQKIWLRRDFDRAAARTLDGRPVQIADPGKWNLLGGPDFRSARLRFDSGPEVTGDVELHLRADDWNAHAHARDPAYGNVVLHVVLFWPEPGTITVGVGGQPIPILPLLPLLHHDLEEYAADEAVEVLANRPTARLTNELAAYAPAELKATLELQASARWRQNVHFTRLRVQRLGWESACHHAALEVLGFRFNRSAMLRIATRWPFSAWAQGEVDLEQAFAAESDAWSLQGVRPANQPRARLRQYAAWTEARPDWPQRLQRFATVAPRASWGGSTRLARREHELGALRATMADELCASAVAGTRFDNLVCDAFFPLAVASAGSPEPLGGWFHWFCGDVPPFVPAALRYLGVCDGKEQPFCHGLAQGVLGWLISRETSR